MAEVAGPAPACAAPARVPTYSAAAYWDTRYATGGAKNFDWFFNYSALKSIFQQYLPSDGSKCLHVGCGNSNIQEGMAADGFFVTNIDVSSVVIDQMKQQHSGFPGLEYVTADCRHMPEFEAGTFGSVLDKGTLDAVLTAETGTVDGNAYMQEVKRLLRPDGVFLLITIGQPAARCKMLQSLGWAKIEALMLPKPLPYLQSEAALLGRTLNLEERAAAGVDKDTNIEVLGPYTLEELKAAADAHTAADYFYAYVCHKAMPE